MKSFSERLLEIEPRGGKAKSLVSEFHALHPLGTTIESADGIMKYKIGIPMGGGVLFYAENTDLEEDISIFAPTVVFNFYNFIIHTNKIKSQKIVNALEEDEDFNLLFRITKVYDETFIIECQIELMARWMVFTMEELLNNLGLTYGFGVAGIIPMDQKLF